MSFPYIRLAQYHDLPEVAHVNAKAFWHDDLCGERIHPYREQYPDDMDLYWLRRAKVQYFDARCLFVLAITQDASGHEVIAGCGQWVRKGKGGSQLDYHWLDPRE